LIVSAQKKTGLGRREGRKRDIPALLLANLKTMAQSASGVGIPFGKTLASIFNKNILSHI